MELVESKKEEKIEENGIPSKSPDFLSISCNWVISNDKSFHDAISVGSHSEAANSNFSLEEIVSVDTCISLKPIGSESMESADPCFLNIKTTNGQKIVGLAVVSEACVLEFFKESGEYSNTVFAEFVDEFEDNSVYLGEACIRPPTLELSIKFTKRKSKGGVMWLYGIKLFLTEETTPRENKDFDYNNIKSFLTNTKQIEMAKTFLESFNDKEYMDLSNFQKFIPKNQTEDKRENEMINNEAEINKPEASRTVTSGIGKPFDIQQYIDDKFREMESRILEKMDLMESRIGNKLDKLLEKTNI